MTNIEAIEYGKEQLEIFGGQHAEFIRMAIEALYTQEENQMTNKEVVKHPLDKNGNPILGQYVKVKDSDWDEPDNVNHPQHYEGKTSLECIDTMRLIFGNKLLSWFCLMNAYKYLWRHKNKNGIEDLEKCEWYLDHVYYYPDDGVPNVTKIDIYDMLKSMLRVANMDYEKPVNEDT